MGRGAMIVISSPLLFSLAVSYLMWANDWPASWLERRQRRKAGHYVGPRGMIEAAPMSPTERAAAERRWADHLGIDEK